MKLWQIDEKGDSIATKEIHVLNEFLTIAAQFPNHRVLTCRAGLLTRVKRERSGGVGDYRANKSVPNGIESSGGRFGDGGFKRIVGDFGYGDDGEGPIGSFGAGEPWDLRDHFRVFYETGWELKQGARSLNEVAKVLLRRRKERRYPADLPSAASSMFLAHEAVSEFFGLRYFQIGCPVELFIKRGKGWPCTGLSVLGRRAWRVTRTWLVFHGYVKNEID